MGPHPGTSYYLSHTSSLTAHVKASTAVIVANLAVLVTWALRLIGHREDSDFQPSDRTPGGSDRSPAKDLSTLRFQRNQGPIVLHSLDRKDPAATRSVASYASNDEMTFAPTVASKDAKPAPATTSASGFVV